MKHLQASEEPFLRVKHPTRESGAHLHTEEPPEAPSMHVKDLRAYEAPFVPLKDPKVPRRTSWFSEGPLRTFISSSVLRFCLNTAYFTYSGMIYQQKHGAAMGSSVSPIIANLYVEGFDEIALRTAPNPTLHCGSGTWTIHLP